jgi:hypothetical protein
VEEEYKAILKCRSGMWPEWSSGWRGLGAESGEMVVPVRPRGPRYGRARRLTGAHADPEKIESSFSVSLDPESTVTYFVFYLLLFFSCRLGNRVRKCS